jgi:hypothetical protein
LSRSMISAVVGVDHVEVADGVAVGFEHVLNQ